MDSAAYAVRAQVLVTPLMLSAVYWHGVMTVLHGGTTGAASHLQHIQESIRWKDMAVSHWTSL